MKGSTSWWRRWLTRLLILMAILVAIWMAGDFAYSRLTAYELAQWEARIERDANGIQQDCQAYTMGNGETALLLIHGINDSPRGYRKMAPALAELGFTCRVMRLPGFAEPIRRFAYATRRDWIAAVEQEVKQLREDHPRVCIVAHSLGGAVTIAYLLDDPQAVDAVVLVAPAIRVSDRRSPLLSTRTWHEIGRYTLWFTSTTQSPFENDARDPAERAYVGGRVFVPRRIFDESFALMDHIQGRAQEITCPLLMVLSKNDQVVDWRAAEAYFQKLGSPVKQLTFARRAGHAILVDYGWEDVTREIADFVD